MKSRDKLLIVTAVWGDWHIQMFLELNLPTLLAEGNLPALSRQCEITYLLFTQDSDFARLDASAEVMALRRHMKVELQALDRRDLSNPIAAHHKAWNIGIARAKAEGQLILLMPPDVAWSQNSFQSVGARLAEGRKAIFMTYLRAVSDAFAPALRARRPAGDVTLSISGPDLVRICFDNIHPLMAAYLRTSEFFPGHAEMMIWTVPDEGILVRVFAREMFLFDPAHLRLNEMSLPTDPIDPEISSFMDDSDDLFAVSLAPLGKDVEWHLDPRAADPLDIGGWWLTYDSPVNDYVAQKKIRWHFNPATESRWRAREQGSDLFVRRTAVAREGIRLWQAAHQLGCAAVASILALAIHTGALTRASKGQGRAIVFLPSDDALSSVAPGAIDRLMTPQGMNDLISAIRDHYIDGSGGVPDSTHLLDNLLREKNQVVLTLASGKKIQIAKGPDGLTADGANIVGKPLIVGGHAIYVVDHLLADVAKSPAEDDRAAAE